MSNGTAKRREGTMKLPDLSTLPLDGGLEFNRLIFSSNPYLLQHARNPVDWFPWTEEAFGKARIEDKPIFLSIGYSTCHWCHVMEHESFEDAEIAEYLNDYFISIKVDREERPDIDHIYMIACQAMTGSGGWPLTVFMTPEKEPFFAGTYFPKEDRFGRMGFSRVLQLVHHYWTNERDRIADIGARLADLLHNSHPLKGEKIDRNALKIATDYYAKIFDHVYGGFGDAPKFPMAHVLEFLLRRYDRTNDANLKMMVERTLDSMYRGGMYDHVGFGFSRYSVDNRWMVPHFEKMLYDNAQLLSIVVELYQITGDPLYQTIGSEIGEYIFREVTAPEGGFYSAEDADSEGEEGKFYLFTFNEFMNIVGEKYCEIMAEYFGIMPQGNFEQGKNILHIAPDREEWLSRHGLQTEEANAMIRETRSRLFSARSERIHPSLDDKILTSWNGLMISALARGGQAFADPRFLQISRRAADFILTRMVTQEGMLFHRYRDGEAAVEGFLDDYAFFTAGLIDLYEATFIESYLEHALLLADRMIENFLDRINGGLFFTSERAEDIPHRIKDAQDSALPSGNAKAVDDLLRLARMTGRIDLEKQAEEILHAFSGQIHSSPAGYTGMLAGLDFAMGASIEIVLTGTSIESVNEMAHIVRTMYLPRKALLFHPAGQEGERIRAICPNISSLIPQDNKPTAYICENFTCKIPATSADELGKLLRKVRTESWEKNAI